MHEPPNPFDCRCTWDGRGWQRSQDCPQHRDLDIGAGTLPPVVVAVGPPIDELCRRMLALDEPEVDLDGPCVKCGEKRTSIRHSAYGGSTTHAFQPPAKTKPYPFARWEVVEDHELLISEDTPDGHWVKHDDAQKAVEEAFWAGYFAFWNRSAFRWQFDVRASRGADARYVDGRPGHSDAFKAWLETKRG